METEPARGCDRVGLPLIATVARLLCRVRSSQRHASAGGTLVYSDQPETLEAVDVNKVLCYSPVSANTEFRVYLRHLNSTHRTRSFSIVIRNAGASEAHVTVNRLGSGNRRSAILAGKDAATIYLEDTATGSQHTIAAGGEIPVATWSVANADVISAICEMSTDAQIKVYIVCGTVPDYNDSSNYVVREPRTHNRGTFEGMSVAKALSSPFVLAAHAAPISIRVGGHTSSGIDYTVSPAVADTIQGSFGVLYEVGIPVTNPGPSPMGVGVVVNARGGTYGGAVRDIAAGNAVIPTPSGEVLSLHSEGVIVSKGNVAAGCPVSVTRQSAPLCLVIRKRRSACLESSESAPATGQVGVMVP